MQIDVRSATVHQGGRIILDAVSCHLAPGEMVGLVGPNGAGKSTFLRALTGLQPLSGGEVLYDGAPARDLGRPRLARRLAHLAQNGDADWPLAVEAIVALGRSPHRRAWAGVTSEDRDAVERAMRAADVVHLRSRPITTLSGGERARVLLARALAVEAEILLADEPFAALDPLHQLQAAEILRDVRRRGAGVLAVMHDLTLAARFCDRILAMSAGRIVADGPPDALTPELLAQIYGVVALRGAHEGEPFLLPWRPLTGTDARKP